MKDHPIYRALSIGEENAKTARELEALTGYTDRAIRREIHYLRKKGYIICSNTRGEYKGYYLPKNDNEVYAFCRNMTNRMQEIWEAKRSAEKYLEDKARCLA